MKKLLIYLTMLVVLIVNSSAISHVCLEFGFDAENHFFMEDFESKTDSHEKSICYCCAGLHSPTVFLQATLLNISFEAILFNHTKHEKNYFSSLNYPPRKPPKI